MLHVIIALMPALGVAVYVFGWRALLMTAVCVASCIIFEWACRAVMHRDNTISDLSAVVTGLLISFNLPVNLPFYMAVIGCFAAIVVVKQLFGGIGQNFANPAIVARIVLMLSFTTQMSSYAKPFYYKLAATDALTGATPLQFDTVTGATPSATVPHLLDMFLGFHGGSLGEVSEAAILIGFIYLLITRVISPITPVAFVGIVALGSFVAGRNVLFELTTGGLMLGAVFMATDYATTPLTKKGKLLFGLICGIITLIIRMFGSLSEGVAFSILLANILTPYLDKVSISIPFGAIIPKKEKAVKNENH
jgi:electron transport complex protein RnfD